MAPDTTRKAEEEIGTETLFIGRCKTINGLESWTYERVSKSAIAHRLQYGERWRLECLDANRVANRNADEVVRLQNAIESALRHHRGGFSIGHVLSDLSRVLIKPTPKEIVVGAETAVDLIAAERRRHVESEGWTFTHDDLHTKGEMAMAAAWYAAPSAIYRFDETTNGQVSAWPWDSKWEKKRKHDRKRQLVIAGSLIVAEIERLQRAESPISQLTERAATIDERIKKLDSGRPTSETMAMQFGHIVPTTSTGESDRITSLQRELAEARAEIDSLKSRPSLTPLTDESVRGVLVDDGEPRPLVHLDLFLNSAGELQQWASYTQSQAKYQPVRLRPASEFGVPAEPAQKLVPLPEGAIVYVPTGEPDRPLKRNEPGIDENGDIWLCECDDDGTSGCSWKPARRVDPALYGVDAGDRVRELEGIREMEEDRVVPSFTVQEAGRTWHYEQLCFDDNELHSLEELARGYGNTTWPDAILKAASDLERLRKAIKEVVNLPLLPLQCRKTLQAALTPPTAASE